MMGVLLFDNHAERMPGMRLLHGCCILHVFQCVSQKGTPEKIFDYVHIVGNDLGR